MTITPWAIKGIGVGACNCDYGCPCQFNGRPSSPDGSCRGVDFTQIEEGYYGEVRLDGLRFAWISDWPGAVHEGGGACQLIIDARAGAGQREALRRIVYNEDTDELLTEYAIFASMCTTVHEPIVAPIELEIDMEARRARCRVPGVVASDMEPVRNPVTGKEHRAQIVLPEGFSCTLIETASGNVRCSGTLDLELSNVYAGFSRVNMTHRGIMRD